MFYSKLRNQKGMAMILTMMIMVVVAIAGITLHQVSSTDVLQVTRDENMLQANLYAKSGVEFAVGHIIENIKNSKLLGIEYIPNQEEEFYGKLGQTAFQNQPSTPEDHNIKFSIEKDTDDEVEDNEDNEEFFIITSEGFVRTGSAIGAQATSNSVTFRISIADLTKYLEDISNDDGNGDNGGGSGGDVNFALFALENIEFEGSSKITGNVGTNTTQSNSVKFQNPSPPVHIDGDLYLNPQVVKNHAVISSTVGYAPRDLPEGNPYKSDAWWATGAYWENITGEVHRLVEPMNFPLPVFPKFPTDYNQYPQTTIRSNEGHTHTLVNAHGDLDMTNWLLKEEYNLNTINIDNNYKFKNILGDEGSNSLYLDIGDYDRSIVVNNLNLSNGHLIVKGNGKLTIYVEGDLIFGSGSTLRHESENPNNVIAFLKSKTPRREIEIGGSQKVYVNFYDENSYFKITAGGGFRGDVITGGSKLTVNGGSTATVQLIYAPNAITDVGGSGIINGSAVVKSVKLTGNSRIISGNLHSNHFFNSLDWGNSSPPTLTPQEQQSSNNEDSSPPIDWRRLGTWN